MGSKIRWWKQLRGLLSTIRPDAGLMPTANLGTGTADATTFLRGDQTYVAMSGGIGGTTGSNDNRLLRSDGTGGNTAQASNATLDDTGNLTVAAGLVAGAGSLAVTTSYDVLVWQGGKLGFASAAVGLGSSGDAYFVRNGVSSLGAKGSGGVDAAFTAGAITASGIIASGSYFSCGSGGSFAYVYGASGGSNGLWLASKNTVAGGVVLRDTGSGYDNISMGSNNRIAWTGTGNNGYNATVDVSLARSASNTLSVYTTQTGTTLGNFSAAAITASGLLCAGTYTAGTLPSAAANAYKFANVSDSSVTTFGSTVAGGGSSKVQVFSNGTNWTVCAI